MQDTHDIYDRIAKRCLTLSNQCTINLINGLYGTDYPIDSTITYNWTEGITDELKRTLADTIVTINGQKSYHIEFQMTKDGSILLRMVEYGFQHALNHHTSDTISFPEPLIVCLYQQHAFPDEYTLNIHFGSQGNFPFKVPVYKYLDHSIQELNDKKLIVLIPFQLLRLRKAIEKERTPENMEALKNLIAHDILDTLNQNVIAGNISTTDAFKLRSMILHLYHHIYQKYDELEKKGVNQMAEEALIFEIDILDYEFRKKIKAFEDEMQAQVDQLQKLEAKKQSLEATKQSLEATNQSLEATLKLQTCHSKIWKLYARGASVSDIAAQVQMSESEVQAILEQD